MLWLRDFFKCQSNNLVTECKQHIDILEFIIHLIIIIQNEYNLGLSSENMDFDIVKLTT